MVTWKYNYGSSCTTSVAHQMRFEAFQSFAFFWFFWIFVYQCFDIFPENALRQNSILGEPAMLDKGSEWRSS